MTGVHCFTSFTYAYLSRARVLAMTLRRVHPDWTIWALIVDELPEGVSAEEAHAGFDRVVFARDLGIPGFDGWLFGHDVVEACTAVKGRMLAELLRKGCETVVYLDPDIAVFSPLDSTLAQLEGGSIVLTPHQTDPNGSMPVITDNELGSLTHGVYNLGFIAVRNVEEGRRFAGWWADMLHLACRDDPASGLFTDQKWCDLVPAFFDGVRIDRDPGCNVASWNLSRRRIEIGQDGGIRVNGSPLKFYHFTKMNGVGDAMTELYAADNIHVHEIWHWYKRAIAAEEMPGIPRDWWAYGRFDNGVPVSRAMRRAHRDDPALTALFPKPLQTAGASYFEWMRSVQPELLKSGAIGFVVLGMHRSGTSALAGWFAARGVCAGDRYIGADDGNPDGYWEHEELVALNDRLLTAAGMDWSTVDAAPPARIEAAGEALSDRARTFLDDLGRGRRFWFMKDPRLCRTLPFWMPRLEALPARILYLHMLRDPWSVARSLTRRDGMTEEHSHLLWALHTLEAELHTRGRPRMWMRFDAMVEGGDAAIHAALRDHLPARDVQELAAGAEREAIRTDRVHAAQPGGPSEDAVIDIGRIYGLLAALSEDDGRSSLFTEIDSWRDRLFRQVRTYRTLLLDRERDALRAKTAALETQSRERLELWRRTDEQLRLVTEQRDRILRQLRERPPVPPGRIG